MGKKVRTAAHAPAPAAEAIEVRVLLFSVLRERVGQASLTATLTPPATGTDLLDRLAAQHPPLKACRTMVRLAVNEQYAPASTQLRDGDEVALITPVSGG